MNESNVAEAVRLLIAKKRELQEQIERLPAPPDGDDGPQERVTWMMGLLASAICDCHKIGGDNGPDPHNHIEDCEYRRDMEGSSESA